MVTEINTVRDWGLGIWKHSWYDLIDNEVESSLIFHVGIFSLRFSKRKKR